MNPDQEFERLFRQEFRDIAPNTIWRNNLGEYEAFEKYKIVPHRPGYRVFCSATEVGVFGTTRSALTVSYTHLTLPTKRIV